SLTRLGRRAEAAGALDRLADGLDAGGRLVDATDAARRALELAESRTRRAILEALVSRLRGATPDDAAERVLDQAAAALAAAGSPTEGSFDRESGGDGSSSRPAGLGDL